MGITGLSLCGFLVVHLAGNLLLFVGQEDYDQYAEMLHSQALLPVAETGLFFLLILHIILGFITFRENAAARKVAYDTKQSKITDPSTKGLPAVAGSLMVPTGLMVLLFLLMHMGHFKLEVLAPGSDHGYDKAVRILGEGSTLVVYLLGSLALGLHLVHGFQSAFQSLGINHPKYTPWIKFCGFVFAGVICIGFALFPILGYANLIHPNRKIRTLPQPHSHSHDEEQGHKHGKKLENSDGHNH